MDSFLTENEKIEDNFLNQYSDIFLQGNTHYVSDEFLLNLSWNHPAWVETVKDNILMWLFTEFFTSPTIMDHSCF